jgi:sRNA-binding carbon storage regulator CsrA
MLILSRKPQESVTVRVPASSEPTTIVVCVTQIRGHKASLGIDAGGHIEISRTELNMVARQSPPTK